jgi:uncharacterized DUF497 family protein
MEFEWDEAKRQTVLEDRGIDFERAKEIWQGTVLEVPSRRSSTRSASLRLARSTAG